MSTEDPRPPDLYQLESAAKDHLDHLVEQFENRLTALAARKAPGRPIEVQDLDQAYSELDPGNREPLRDTQEIISWAITENRAGERVVYFMTGALFLHFPEFCAFHLRKNSPLAAIQPGPGLVVRSSWAK